MPAAVRERHPGRGTPVLRRYERVCFDKDTVDGPPRAMLVCPGNPLLDATIDLVLERHRDVLEAGAVLVDDEDPGDTVRLLFYLEHAVQDGRRARDGSFRIASRRLCFLEVEGEVRARLLKEINHWDRRAEELKARERAGKRTRLPAHVAQERAERLNERLALRLAELQRERDLSPRPPSLRGGALIVPAGLIHKLRSEPPAPAGVDHGVDAAARARIERLAMDAVLAAERALGREPRDVHAHKGLGHDIESRDPATGDLYFIEVKGRIAGADAVTLTKNEILCALNVPERFRLAVVIVDGNGDGSGEKARAPVYITGLDYGQLGFGQTAASYHLATLLACARPPH